MQNLVSKIANQDTVKNYGITEAFFFNDQLHLTSIWPISHENYMNLEEELKQYNNPAEEVTTTHFVYDLHSMQTKFEGTLQQCYNELKHCAGLGIASILTGKTTVLRTINGFRLPLKKSQYYSRIDAKLSRLHNWY
jgi:uncharacterized protein YqgV (UPF0045/DUF77 family)